MDNKDTQKIDVIMKDYEILKTYSTITSPSIRYNLISIFFATIGVIFSGSIIALSSGIEKLNNVAIVISFLWGVFIPAFSLSILYIWLGEEERMGRIGLFLREKEDLVNQKLGEEILNWETYKRKHSIQYPEILIIAMLFGLSLCSSIAGLYLIYKTLSFISLTSFSVITALDVVGHAVFEHYTHLFINQRVLATEKLE